MPPATLAPFIQPLPQKPRRAENQHRDQNEKGVDILVFGGEVAGSQRLDDPQEQATGHRPRHVADPAQNGGGERLHPPQITEGEVDAAVVEADHHAGAGGQERADHEGGGDDGVHVDSQELGHQRISGGGLDGYAQLGPVYEPPEADHQQQRRGDHGELQPGKRNSGQPNAAGNEQLGKYPVARPHGEHHEVLQKYGGAEGADEGGKFGSIAQG